MLVVIKTIEFIDKSLKSNLVSIFFNVWKTRKTGIQFQSFHVHHKIMAGMGLLLKTKYADKGAE